MIAANHYHGLCSMYKFFTKKKYNIWGVEMEVEGSRKDDFQWFGAYWGWASLICLLGSNPSLNPPPPPHFKYRGPFNEVYFRYRVMQ